MDAENEVGQAIVDALAQTESGKTPLDLVAEIPILENTLDEIIGHRIDAARDQGLSWEAIAMRLGISRQAAHKRFGKKSAKRAKKSGLRFELRVDRD